MIAIIVRSMGWLLARLPVDCSRLLCWLAGSALFYGTRKGRLALSNLHHAFPEAGEAWRREVARESCRRSIEMFTLAIALPYLRPERLRRVLEIPAEARSFFQQYRHQPLLVLLPHGPLMESMVLLPALVAGLDQAGVFYRPLDNPGLDRWVRQTRSRWGVQLLSRRSDVHKAREILRANGVVAVLFDQNAGFSGALISFFDRLASASELPGLLAQKHRAQVVAAHPKRLGFWRGVLEMTPLHSEPTTAAVTVAANRWLENLLRNDAEARAGWLWIHNRWKTQDEFWCRFRIHLKRNFIPDSLLAAGQGQWPRRTRFWVRLPNWLGDTVMALPLLRALRMGRPDAEITLLGKPPVLALLQSLGIGDAGRPLPPRNSRYFLAFRRWRTLYPDTVILLTNSFRGDLEACLLRAPQRFGIRRPGHPRPLLTHAWKKPSDLDEAALHQTRLWELYFRYFGLEETLDLTPLRLHPDPSPAVWKPRIGLICGTENSPEKRWPTLRWRELTQRILTHHPRAEVHLFGTIRDRPIAQMVAAGLDPLRVEDRTGKTDLVELARELKLCRVVACNDTGGMHLANALGVPVAAIYGPTNPVRTGPIFAAPTLLLQPPGCPPTGGAAIDRVSVDRVFEEVKRFLAPPAAE